MNFYSVVCLGLLSFTTGVGCQPNPEPVRPTFAAEPALQALVSTVAARYVTATGRADIKAEQAGDIPVYFAEDLFIKDKDGKHITVCALTTWYEEHDVFVGVDIAVDPTPPFGCPSFEASLAHEFIHAMNPNAVHTEEGTVFAVMINEATKIDDHSLAELCTEFECPVFQPEVVME